MGRLLKIVMFAALGVVLAGCGGDGEREDEVVRVALITGLGGLGDRSFSDSAWEGFKRAERELGVVVKVVEPQSVADYQTTISSVASAGYDLIMGVGADQFDALDMCSKQYPDTKFAAINLKLEADNVQVAQFADHEGAFMAGALAAMFTKTGVVGFIGGADSPAINRFYVGFEEGAIYANPEVRVLSYYVGSFADPGKGKEFAVHLISQDADVIFHAAGKTGEGLFEAVKEYENVYAIGVDRNQDYIVEGKILSSMEKRVNVAAYDMIKSLVEGRFEPGFKAYGIAEDGVGLTDMEYTKDLIGEETIRRLEEIRADIIAGRIIITDTFAVQ